MNQVKNDRMSNEYLNSRDYRFGYRKTDFFYKGTKGTFPKGVQLPGLNSRGTVGP
jgi:hypothetical protein